MYAVGMLGSYLMRGVYAVAGPFQPFGGAVDIIVVQQEDGSFKSSPWYVKFGDFPGVLKRREKIVDLAVNDVPADFHMFLDNSGEAYFEKEVESEEGMCLALPDLPFPFGDNRAEGEMERSARTEAHASSHTQEEMSSRTASAPRREQCEIVDGRHSAVTNTHVGSEVDRLSCDSGFFASAPRREQCEIVDGRRSAVEKNVTDTHVGSEVDRLSSDSGFFALEKHVTGQDMHVGVEVDRVPFDMSSALCAVEKIATENDTHVGLEEDRVSLNMSSQEALNTPEAFCAKVAMEAVHTENDNHHMNDNDRSTSLTATEETNVNLKETVLESQELVKTVRSDTVATEGCICYSSSIQTAEEGSCLQAVTAISSGEAGDAANSESKPCVNDDNLLEDVCSEEDNGTDGHYENGYGDDEVFAAFECIAIEEEGQTHIYPSEDGMNADVLDDLVNKEVGGDSSLVWDMASSANEDSSSGALASSQSSQFSTHEKSGNEECDGAVLERESICKVNEGIAVDNAASQAVLASISSPSGWRLWPFWFRRSRIKKGPLFTSSVSEQALLAAANVAAGSPFAEELLQKNVFYKWQQKTKVRTYVPTSAQLASLNLNYGPNKVTFTFSTVLGNTEVDARIYLWNWNTRIVISDVDGTITKSDVLGQVMPLVGRDWSQYGVTRLFSAIKDNGFEVLFLSARAISQAYLTRRFLLNLKQDGEALPEGPVFISPDGLIPSLYREVIRRAPHEFKISCLEGIRELFPKDVNPFYAGFGNRETDEISYLKVGIPKGKIYIINPKGEVVVNHRVDCKSYMSLHALVDDMFPPKSSQEQEDFNAWNFWKMPIPDIDEDELSTVGTKNAKRTGSLKK